MISTFHKRALLWVVVLSGVLLGSAIGASTAEAQEFAPGRMYVVVPDSVRPLAFGLDTGLTTTSYPCLDSLNRAWGFLDINKSFPHRDNWRDGIYTVVFPDSVNLDTVVAAYRASGCLDDAYRMVQFQLHAVPDDPHYSNLADTAQRQWALDGSHSRVEQAWDITTGDSQLVIAVIDGAIYWEHPDLKDNIWINPEEDVNRDSIFEPWSSTKDSNGTFGDLDGIDNDSNGYVDDVIGLQFLDGEIPYKSDVRQVGTYGALWHGTYVASIIAARTNNANGMAGIAGGWGGGRGVKLMAVAMQTLGGGYTDLVIQNAIEYAKNAGADIISMSWGFVCSSLSYTPSVRRIDSLLAVAYLDSNVICVASAGNDGAVVIMVPAVLGEVSFGSNYPSAWRDTNRVIGVGSLGFDNKRCPGSNFGAGLIDVGAPGFNWGAWVFPDGSFGYNWWPSCATSWAAPAVAGIAGLVRSAYPGLDKVEVITRMRDGCSFPYDPEIGDTVPFRSGHIDALRALSKAPESPWFGNVQLWEDVIVAPGEVLVVYPGTKVFTPKPPADFALSGFDTSRAEIIVYGTLIARGRKANPIIFQGKDSASAGYSDWGGIIVRDGGKAILDTVIIKNATTGITFDTAGVCSLRAVTINQCQSFGIDIASENVSIRNSHVSDISDGYGIRVNSGAKVNLYADTIQNAYGGIEFFATGPCTLQASVIESCTVHGIYTQSDSLAISYTTIHDVASGTGIVGVGATADLYHCYVYRCPVGMSLDAYSGGEVRESRFGDGVETEETSVGLSLNCPVYVWQTLIDGPFPSAGVKVLGSSPSLYACKIDGRGAGRYGLWALQGSGPKLRCTEVVGQDIKGVYGYKADMDLGQDLTGEYGNNMFDASAGVTIQSTAKAVKAERNYYWCSPDTLDCQMDSCGPLPVFFGEVDYDPWLRCRQDSCAYIPTWNYSIPDTADPPVGGGNNKTVAAAPRPEHIASLNYPNPFNPSTVIRYNLSVKAEVKVSIINIMGQEVRVLADQVQTAGLHELLWDGKDGRGQSVASGVYFYHVLTGGQTQSRKMVLLR